jgi:hypothetical protein
MADETSILRAAEEDLATARRLLGEHAKSCKNLGCPDCVSLTGHVERTQHQVGLLRAEPEMEALF